MQPLQLATLIALSQFLIVLIDPGTLSPVTTCPDTSVPAGVVFALLVGGTGRPSFTLVNVVTTGPVFV